MKVVRWYIPFVPFKKENFIAIIDFLCDKEFILAGKMCSWFNI